MRIAIIWHCVYPWDIRIEKVLNLLSKHGHKIHLICKGREGLPETEDIGPVRTHRIFVSSSSIGSNLSKMLSYPIFLNPVWIYSIVKILIKNRVGLIIVRDLPLALLAGILGKALRIPVLLDMAENYPAALIAYSKARYKPFLLMDGFLPRFYEQWSLKFMEHVFIVAEEQRTRLMKLGVPEDKMSCIRNTPELRFFSENTGCGGENGTDLNSGATLLYVGKIDKHRGVDILIRAMPEILKRYPKARLQIIGDGTERTKLIEMVEGLTLKESVIFEGWIEFSRVPRFIGNSTICLIPHLLSEHTNTTIPNKIFDYMAMGKPVIVSNCEPLARIVREEKCGLIFRSGDSDDFSRKVIKLLEDKNRNVYGLNGKKAVELKYNWQVDSENMLKTINNMSLLREKGYCL